MNTRVVAGKKNHTVQAIERLNFRTQCLLRLTDPVCLSSFHIIPSEEVVIVHTNKQSGTYLHQTW